MIGNIWVFAKVCILNEQALFCKPNDKKRMKDFKIKQEGEFKYLEAGSGPVILILHGLFGALSNFRHVVSGFCKRYRLIIPLMPIYEKSRFQSTVEGLTEYVDEFVKFKKLENFTLLGNSLGGTYLPDL